MTIYNDALSEYTRRLFAGDTMIADVPASSVRQGLPEIEVLPEEGRFLEFLVRACGASKILEIGTLGGYSTLWMGRGLPAHGKIITLDIDPHHAAVAAGHFKAAGLDGRIEQRLGDANALLPQLESEGPFDLVFIDADKASYRRYFEWAIEHTRSGGIIAAHNAFWYGAVLDETKSDADTLAIRDLNAFAASHPGLVSTIYPAGDGTLICVRSE